MIKIMLMFLLLMYLISQIVIPLFIPRLKFFWLHEKNKTVPKTKTEGSLQEARDTLKKAQECFIDALSKSQSEKEDALKKLESAESGLAEASKMSNKLKTFKEEYKEGIK